MGARKFKLDWPMIVALVGLAITVLAFLFGDNFIQKVTPQPTEVAGACSKALPKRLAIGVRGRVTTVNNTSKVFVRKDHSTDADLVNRMDPGAEFTVTNGPFCDAANQWWWWKVKPATG